MCRPGVDFTVNAHHRTAVRTSCSHRVSYQTPTYKCAHSVKHSTPAQSGCSSRCQRYRHHTQSTLFYRVVFPRRHVAIPDSSCLCKAIRITRCDIVSAFRSVKQTLSLSYRVCHCGALVCPPLPVSFASPLPFTARTSTELLSHSPLLNCPSLLFVSTVLLHIICLAPSILPHYDVPYYFLKASLKTTQKLLYLLYSPRLLLCLVFPCFSTYLRPLVVDTKHQTAIFLRDFVQPYIKMHREKTRHRAAC